MNPDAISRPGLWLLLGVALFPILALACGPFFPNSLLMSGDDAVLQAPTVRFVQELARLQLEPPPYLPAPLKAGNEREVTLDSEILDLRRALSLTKTPSNVIAERVLGFSRSRADVEDHRRALEAWETPREVWYKPEPDEESAETNTRPRPELTFAAVPEGLPREFELYLRGAAAWHDHRTNEARRAWSDLLALPVKARPYKTVWATFMLGRSWHSEDAGKATRLYEDTRRLVRSGFSDSAGLAISSLGWQAQLRLRTNDLAGALRLYLDQYSAGSSNASASIGYTAGQIARAPDDQRLAIAQNRVFRRVVTAWILSSFGWSSMWAPDTNAASSTAALARQWLDTLESAGASEVALAEQLAVLAYQSGDYAAAARWVELSGDSAVATWIKAKLLLRDGKLEESAAQLARVVEQLPLDPPARARGEPPEFIDSLFDIRDDTPGRHEALGELGTLRLSRGEFSQALDALLRGGFWQDAAYVAERVLTTDELKAYVDSSWPVLTGRAAAMEEQQEVGDRTRRGQRERIRHLLARRLNRDQRGPEALAYFPANWQPGQTRFLDCLKRGMNGELATRDRARALFEAAWLARTNGLELLGTVAGPDWAIWDGDYESGPTHPERATNSAARFLKPTTNELQRAEAHGPLPEERFHYRYAAARMAWESARLLPNNDPETATILWTAGRWLKSRDPETADIFYKALVRRCRKTELGDAADRQRWFPELDAQGHPVVTRGIPEILPPVEEEPRHPVTDDAGQ